MEQMIKFSSDLKNLNIAESILDSISVKTNLNEFIYGNILIALNEAISNAIVHGNKFSQDKEVTVVYNICENIKLTVSVQDEGTGFDYSLVPDPTDPENIEKLNGRGVFLIQHLADEVSYLSDGKVVKMTFNLN